MLYTYSISPGSGSRAVCWSVGPTLVSDQDCINPNSRGHSDLLVNLKETESPLHDNILRLAQNIVSEPNPVLNCEYDLLPSNKRYGFQRFNQVCLKNSLVQSHIKCTSKSLLHIVFSDCDVMFNIRFFVSCFLILYVSLLMELLWCAVAPGKTHDILQR